MIYYRFEVDGRGFRSAWRKTWREAAADAIEAGYATPMHGSEIRLAEGAEIRRAELTWRGDTPIFTDIPAGG